MRAGRPVGLISLLLLLGSVPGCGQMGPLRLPDPAQPVGAEQGDSQLQDRDDDGDDR